MVWCDEIEQNAIWTDLTNVNPNDYGTTCYDDTFILIKDGKMYAAGTNIGTDSKRNTPYGEGEDDERSDENKCTTYSAKFLPIEVKEYVPESNPTEEYTGEKKILRCTDYNQIPAAMTWVEDSESIVLLLKSI